jgi:hypothetical protein
MAGTLELRTEKDGRAYFLDGRALVQGEAVELLLANGQWLAGVYEWTGFEIRWPALRFELGGDGPAYAERNQRTAAVSLPPDAVLRRSAHEAQREPAPADGTVESAFLSSFRTRLR